MTQRRAHLKARLATLSLIACLVATQAGAQAGANDLPTAKEIWRHLYDPASEPVPHPAPKPLPKPTPPASAAPRSSAPAAAARPSAPEATAAAPSRTLAEARVVIHYPERGGYERSEELMRLLRIMGTAEVETRPVRYPAERQSIRYFHAADRDVSGIIGDMVGGGGRATVSDFTFYRPFPRNGTIEIWLP
ncbi:hypothetical protein [Paracoccus benzoatiresistens]|uniref:Uncharacterized protein n=1 Tax=Paracoccus benzoatiresistens TaxID=2997341 RepID=A0ABT4JAT7_9RHOB|nr:hypothetical protein [Paracoccus sp. EF6]MCZ0964245.1 hypothetical protein [Paracoccus sp. EF6]